MNNVLDFKGKEIAFLKTGTFPFRGYQITGSENLVLLKKILKISEQEYNTYVTVAKYSDIPRFPINPKEHWEQFREWVKIRDQTITRIDFMLDFDAEPTIKGLKKAWEDVKTAIFMLFKILGEQTKYLTIWFSGNKGFHILGKCKIGSTWGNTAQEVIDKQKEIAMQLSLVCPTLDTTIYDTARLRKLLGSKVYSPSFGETRVIPISNKKDIGHLISALKTKNKSFFKQKELIRINNIHLQL